MAAWRTFLLWGDSANNCTTMLCLFGTFDRYTFHYSTKLDRSPFLRSQVIKKNQLNSTACAVKRSLTRLDVHHDHSSVRKPAFTKNKQNFFQMAEMKTADFAKDMETVWSTIKITVTIFTPNTCRIYKRWLCSFIPQLLAMQCQAFRKQQWICYMQHLKITPKTKAQNLWTNMIFSRLLTKNLIKVLQPAALRNMGMQGSYRVSGMVPCTQIFQQIHYLQKDDIKYPLK